MASRGSNLTRLARYGTAAQHLIDDAELAEDLAIRYADIRVGPNDGYGRTRDDCMAALFTTIAKNHKVTTEQVREVLGQRPMGFDAAVLFSFAAFYFLVSYFLAKRVCRRFPIHESWVTASMSTIGLAILVSFIGMLMLETMAFLAEGIRLGNDHVSYRGSRIPWAQNRMPLFAGGILLFCLAAALRYRTSPRDTEATEDRSITIKL